MISDLKPYPAMKDSGLPWLGPVPEHWDLSPNRRLIRRRKALVGVRHAEYKLLSLTKQGVIVRDVESGRGKFSADMGTCQEVRTGDLVFCFFDVPETPRTVGLSRHDGMITGAYTVFECPDPVLSAYLDLFYRAMDDRKLLSPLYSGLRNTIQLTRFLGTKTPVPPAPEQAAIVRFLDHADGRIRRYIRDKQKLITLLEEQKQAVVHRAVTRGLDPNVRLKASGVKWLGDVPEHWEVVPNRTLLRIRKDVVGAASDRYTLLSLTKRGVIPRDLENPEGKFPTAFDTYQAVQPGDLIFCLFDIDETPRAVGLATTSGMVTGAYTRFECLDPRAAQFIYSFYIAMDNGKLLKPLYTGLRKVITKSAFLSAKMPLPPSAEREAIVEELKTNSEQVDAARDRAVREIDLLREYRTRLIADVVTGKLDVREAAGRLPDAPEELEPLDEADTLTESKDDVAKDLDAIPEEAEA